MSSEPTFLDRGPRTEDANRFIVVVPVLNEENHIENCVNSLLPQITSKGEIMVAAGSVDRTRCLGRCPTLIAEEVCRGPPTYPFTRELSSCF